MPARTRVIIGANDTRVYTVAMNRTKPAWVRLQDNNDARKAAAAFEAKQGSHAAIILGRARQTPEFAAGLAAARKAADAIFAIGDEAAIVTALKAAGGWTPLLTAAFEASVAGATIPGSFGSDAPIAGALNNFDLQAIRADAYRAANS